MLKKIVIPGEKIEEEVSEDTDDTDTRSTMPYPENTYASIKDMTDSDMSSIFSPASTRSSGKAKKTKRDRQPFHKGCRVSARRYKGTRREIILFSSRLLCG